MSSDSIQHITFHFGCLFSPNSSVDAHCWRRKKELSESGGNSRQSNFKLSAHLLVKTMPLKRCKDIFKCLHVWWQNMSHFSYLVFLMPPEKVTNEDRGQRYSDDHRTWLQYRKAGQCGNISSSTAKKKSSCLDSTFVDNVKQSWKPCASWVQIWAGGLLSGLSNVHSVCVGFSGCGGFLPHSKICESGCEWLLWLNERVLWYKKNETKISIWQTFYSRFGWLVFGAVNESHYLDYGSSSS